MATIQKRGERWRAIVRIRGASQSKTFATKALAAAWAKRIESEIEAGEATGIRHSTKTVRELIDWYVREVGPTARWQRSKESGLRKLRGMDWSTRQATRLTASDFIDFARIRREEGAGPSTINQDVMYLRGVFKSARSIGVTVNLQALADASIDLKQRKAISKAGRRSRRPTDDELNRLREYFRSNAPSVPMADIIDFAILTTRRQAEITRLLWSDVDRDKGIAWINDVKHPTKREGNRKAFRLLPEALAIIERQPRSGLLVFPYSSKYVGKLFREACAFLGIEDLHFHDLRHHGTSLLFESGYQIHEVALFTLHESWAMLQRYTHLRPENVPIRPLA